MSDDLVNEELLVVLLGFLQASETGFPTPAAEPDFEDAVYRMERLRELNILQLQQWPFATRHGVLRLVRAFIIMDHALRAEGILPTHRPDLIENSSSTRLGQQMLSAILEVSSDLISLDRATRSRK